MNREPNFDENEVLRQCMSSLNEEVPDMPENFHAQWTALGKEDAMKQDTVRIIEKDILAAYDEQTEKAEKPEKPEPLPADTDFRSEFKLDLDELKFGRNYDPNK